MLARLALLITVTLSMPAASAKDLVEPERVYKQGEALADIARDFYGSPHYELVILKHNNLKDKRAIPNGTALKVPDLADLLVAEGIRPEMMDDVNAIVKARYTFVKLENEVLKVHAAAGKAKTVTLPVRLRDDLTSAAGTIETAAKSLAKKGKYGDSPTRFKNRLLEAAASLRRLAKGANDAKIDDGVHLLFAQAWVRAIMWVRNEDGDG